MVEEHLMKGQKKVQYMEALRFIKVESLGFIRRESGIAIDGGAHVGSWTKLMLQSFNEVHAFEPCLESFKLLADNLAYERDNGSALLYNRALMDKDCKVNVFAPGRQTLTARQVEYGDEVHGITIDGLGLKGCDFIKLDLEGAEPLAIVGAMKTLRKFKPFLVIEVNPQVQDRFETTFSNMFKALTKIGYKKVWQHDVDWGFQCKQL